MDPLYEPPEMETRQVYGISMQQKRNDCKIDASLFQNIVTKNKNVSILIPKRGVMSLTLYMLSFPNPPLLISLSPHSHSNTLNPIPSAMRSTVPSLVSAQANSHVYIAPVWQETKPTTGGYDIIPASFPYHSRRLRNGPTKAKAIDQFVTGIAYQSEGGERAQWEGLFETVPEL